MARHYSQRTFLRLAPNKLLQRYFEGKRIALGIPWQQVAERNPGPVFAALQRLDNAVRGEVDRDFRDILAMADDGGVKTLIDEGKFRHHGVDLTVVFSGMKSHLERAFSVFLTHQDIFRVARRFQYADGLPKMVELCSWMAGEKCRELALAV